MYTILIVDDHKHIVDSMCATIHWEAMNILSIHKAYSAVEAFEIIKTTQIHILLTDIRMPGMSGLELIERAQRLLPHIQCVLLTGYAHFEYARKAVELRAVDYLIKPVRDEEICRVIGKITEQLEESSVSIKKNRWIRQNLPLLKSGFPGEPIEGRPVNGSRFSSVNSPPPQKLDSLKTVIQPPTLMQLIESNHISGVGDKLESIFKEIDTKWPCSRTHLTEAYFHIIGGFVHLAHKNGVMLEEITGNHNISGRAALFRSLQHLKEWSMLIYSLLKEHIQPTEQSASHIKIVEGIHSYIKEHLADNVTLAAIADHVYFHPGYLSKIYKEATGINISDFILAERMEKARLLLEESHMKIYEITKKVGYQSVQHFIREFKKYYGITPKNYRCRPD
ncbi:response regulator [Paenibacillus sepulcri]|uniref:Response regulator n=1 Tax=Paenibacillus sepulcri TaxID=359917 RepID=A0ABS7BYN2_9BACL|nr:response regulator [Paenibacillus sepulcri]